MKIMMIQLPHFYDDTERAPEYYPLGIGYLVSVLKQKHDMIPMDLWMAGAAVNDAVSLISKHDPDIYCISVYATQYPYFKEITSVLKKRYPGKYIIAGGPAAASSYEILLKSTGVDYCVICEGERTMEELIDNLDHPENVNGIAYLNNDQAVLTPRRQVINNLDELPFPDRDFYDFEKYMKNLARNNQYLKKSDRPANIITGRGCPYKCTYCSKTFSGVRSRSVSSIIDEISFLIQKYNITAVFFNDELVILNKKRTLDLCRRLEPLGIKWICQGRINLMDEEILHSMKNAGCIAIGYGIESYSQKILDNMKKQLRLEDIVPVIELTRNIGIEVMVQYMYGYPGEDDESIVKTEEFFKKIDHLYVGSTATPLPGTELYQTALDKGLIKDEEEYLCNLTMGYNPRILNGEYIDYPLVNLTDFSNDEFAVKKKKLRDRINSSYYSRHPVKKILMILNRYIRIMKMFVYRPNIFWKKVYARLKNKF
ncbi:B12-binding domain-containing radical SAM protein [bacterium]